MHAWTLLSNLTEMAKIKKIPNILGFSFLFITSLLLVLFNFFPQFFDIVPVTAIGRYHSLALKDHLLQELRTINFHALFGISMVALILIQMSDEIRRKYLLLHRYCGYLYVLVGSVCVGMTPFMTRSMYAREFAEFAVYTLVLFWFFSLGVGLFHLYKKNIKAHKRWMTRNFFVTVSTFFIRPWVFVELLFNPQKNIEVILSNGFWISAILAIILSEWYLEATGQKSFRKT